MRSSLTETQGKTGPTIAEVAARWTARRAEWSRLGARLDGEKLASEILADLTAIVSVERDTLLSVKAAAAETGYSADSLGRMIRVGKLENHGSKRRPLVRRDDLPRRVRSERRVAATMDTEATSIGAVTRLAVASRLHRA